jgi:hypothetical protein
MGALRDFVADILECEGAAIEAVEPNGLDVLPPEPVRAALGWPEFVRLGFGAALPPGAVSIGLEGDWLNHFGALLGERGRIAERQLVTLENVTARSDPQRLLDRTLDLPNATWRLHDAKPAWTRCLLLAFRYTAISDEKREGIIWFGFNQGTGAVIDGEILGRLRALSANIADWQVPDPAARAAMGPGWDARTLAARVPQQVEHHVRRDLEPFLKAIRRRLDYDSVRVHEYYDQQRRTAQIKLAELASVPGERVEDDRKRETMRIATIEREYAAKLDDLRHNYALRVTADWTQGLILFAPVYRYDVLIKRRKVERMICIDWHPAIRLIERPPCDWGLGIGAARWVCDDRLHLTDMSGQAPCSSCGKPWCRACTPMACPRCGRT